MILIPAIFDQHKQLFYDKIAETVVIDYKPEECHLNLNYAGIIRRAIAYIIDHFIIKGILLVFVFFLAKMIFSPFESKLLIMCLPICLFLLPSIILEIFMVRRFGGTPGQLLCRIRIKDADTIENVTLAQAIIRYVSFKVIRSSIFIMRRFSVKYTSEWWFGPLSDLILMAIILIFVCAIFDRRKQFLHDKIAKTVAINYKPSR
ncbi:RDD family protein [Wolbachia endosymbiont (group A) of Myopa testacea]|uniref:RDD family protein n=1 Tax=Wolbachia endosymbiont (group A) of Myopa testacea TaxID=3066148 RepID=UPI0031332BBB